MILRALKSHLLLFRINIALFAACSAFTGFLLVPSCRISGGFVPAFAVFLLASGASALNQFQERDIDAKMQRTRKRPLPSGAISPARALSLVMFLVTSGLALLAYRAGTPALALGLAALLWYNGLYTPLKKVTAFASIPGAVVGMFLPAIGWVSAGGALMDLRIAGFCFIMFLWQVPHFWLLLLARGEEYEQAGLPSLVAMMNREQLARVCYAWIFAATIACLALPLYGSVGTPAIFFPLAAAGLWLLWSERSLAGANAPLSPSPALFRNINVYMFLVMSILSFQNVISRT